MRSYEVPRDVSGEDRILFIFSRKALIYTAIGAAIGLPVHLILKGMGMSLLGYIVLGLLGLVGFLIGTFKMPPLPWKWAKVNAGEEIDDIIKRAYFFKKRKNKIYIYKEGKTNDNR